MTEVALLLSDDDFTKNTSYSGNIDKDKYRVSIKKAQLRFIKKLLNSKNNTLYTRIYDLYVAGNGVITLEPYKTIYEDYVFNMLIAKSDELYSGVGAYTFDNKGISKIQSENTISISKTELDSLRNMATIEYEDYKNDFLEYMNCDNVDIPEWEKCSGVNNRVKVIGGIIFKKRYNDIYNEGKGFYN